MIEQDTSSGVARAFSRPGCPLGRAFVPPSGSTPARTPALPARGLLHGRRSSRNLREPKRNTSLVVQMVGRLLPHEAQPAIRQFMSGITQAAPRPWLRPLQATLDPPGTGFAPHARRPLSSGLWHGGESGRAAGRFRFFRPHAEGVGSGNRQAAGCFFLLLPRFVLHLRRRSNGRCRRLLGPAALPLARTRRRHGDFAALPVARFGRYFFGNFGSALISRICKICRCAWVEISSNH